MKQKVSDTREIFSKVVNPCFDSRLKFIFKSSTAACISTIGDRYCIYLW